MESGYYRENAWAVSIEIPRERRPSPGRRSASPSPPRFQPSGRPVIPVRVAYGMIERAYRSAATSPLPPPASPEPEPMNVEQDAPAEPAPPLPVEVMAPPAVAVAELVVENAPPAEVQAAPIEVAAQPAAPAPQPQPQPAINPGPIDRDTLGMAVRMMELCGDLPAETREEILRSIYGIGPRH